MENSLSFQPLVLPLPPLILLVLAELVLGISLTKTILGSKFPDLNQVNGFNQGHVPVDQWPLCFSGLCIAA